MDIRSVKFDDKGLVPCIVQDYYSGAVLMMAYMSRESLETTLREGRTCFYSRSRRELWRKGETSGNVQRVMTLSADCDGDTLLARVICDGPACHTGERSCFFDRLHTDDTALEFSMDGLYDLLADRKQHPQEKSYTTYLFENGDDKILKKIGEECTEVIIGAKNDDKTETVYEIADLAYHVLVLMAHKGITLLDIRRELAGRHVVDKKEKQKSMTAEKEEE